MHAIQFPREPIGPSYRERERLRGELLTNEQIDVAMGPYLVQSDIVNRVRTPTGCFGPMSCNKANPYHDACCNIPERKINKERLFFLLWALLKRGGLYIDLIKNVMLFFIYSSLDRRIKYPPFLAWVLSKKGGNSKSMVKSMKKILTFVAHKYCYECNEVRCLQCSTKEIIISRWKKFGEGPICCGCVTKVTCVECYSLCPPFHRSEHFNPEKPLCESCIFTETDKCIKCGCKQNIYYKVQPCFCDSCKKDGCVFIDDNSYYIDNYNNYF